MAAISLCMIVKDEEAVLERCLDCFGELADEIVIVDTGSSDRTREIAGKYTSRVYGFPWCGDFSAARNYGFERATKEYCMWVDADDVMRQEDRRRFLEMKKTLPADTDVVLLPYETGFDSEGRPVFSYYRERIVRNSPEFRFMGRVHETIPLKGTLRYDPLTAGHSIIMAGNCWLMEDMRRGRRSSRLSWPGRTDGWRIRSTPPGSWLTASRGLDRRKRNWTPYLAPCGMMFPGERPAASWGGISWSGGDMPRQPSGMNRLSGPGRIRLPEPS